MTLMRIDRAQSPTHKGGFLQGGKSPIHSQNANHTNHQRKGSPPPNSKQHTNHNNNNDKKAQQQQQQQQQPQSNNSSRYKTELCRPYEEHGTCKYGDKCQFAHGAKELRSMARHPKYKTELCRTFHSTGLCPYGPRCHFIHNSEQTKKTLMTSLARAKPLDSTGDSPPASRGGTPTSPRTFSDLYANNVFFGDYQQQQHSPLYSPDVYGDSVSVFNDNNVRLDNHSFQLDLFPLDTPASSPVDANIFRLPIFDAFKKL